MSTSAFQVNYAYQRSLLLKSHESQLIMFLVPDSASLPQAWRESVADRKNAVYRRARGLSAIKGVLGVWVVLNNTLNFDYVITLLR